ncbi:uncharacterized protein LOC125490418 [Plutella xylostella]|uniref:uncharacterized protein LOC125490418 n=1 Tax=Plutella xylostella TaxID=51655 RepID=UPI002032B01A|nr:uncharacterized protein LOC125490418 [Plutella xylostella]
MTCILVLNTISRLSAINEHLGKFTKEKNNTYIFTIKEHNKVRKNQTDSTRKIPIRDLAITYDAIGEICSSINGVSNYEIFMKLITTFSFVIIAIWTTVYQYRQKQDISETIATITVWIVSGMMPICFLGIVCDRLITTRRETQVLVNEIIMESSLPKAFRLQAQTFMQLIEAWPLEMYVYDMFAIDKQLILKFSSVCTTYMIIIIQISHFTNT